MATKKKSAAKKVEIVEVVQVYQDAEGDWRWRGVAGNGKTVAESGEGYRNRMYAAKMAKALNASARLEWH
jgi:uncharacterized protein YegP (UPF0339 family)